MEKALFVLFAIIVPALGAPGLTIGNLNSGETIALIDNIVELSPNGEFDKEDLANLFDIYGLSVDE